MLSVYARFACHGLMQLVVVNWLEIVGRLQFLVFFSQESVLILSLGKLFMVDATEKII